MDGQDAGEGGGGAQGQVEGDAHGIPEPMNNVHTVSKWKGRTRIARRDRLSHLSMFNFTVKNSWVGVKWG